MRESTKQQSYRSESRSKNKDKPDVSHNLSLQEVSDITAESGGVNVENKEELKQLKTFSNDAENMKMKNSHTNRSKDKKDYNQIKSINEQGKSFK